MRTTRLVSTLFSLALLSVSAGGCSKSADSGPASAAEDEATAKDSIIEEHEAGTITWTVTSDGQAKALVKSSDGKPITSNVNGTLAWKGEGGTAKMVVLSPDAKASALVGAGPKLEADLTEVGYTVTVDGKPWTGTLHLPPGGTAELVANARAAADLNLEGKVGPHGGVIQVVGEDRFEIVAADDASGEVRVYLLDPDLKVIAIGERKITLGIVADTPEVVVLVPEPEAGLYVRGKLNLKADPIRITLAVRQGANVKVALVGFRPGVHVMVGAKAPSIKIRVKAAAFADIDGRANVKAKVKVKGPDVNVKVKVPEPEVKVKTKAKASAGAHANANAGAGAKASAKVKVGL
jgi:hypothetical protein